MTIFLVRRTALLLISLAVASVVIFALLRLLPGDVAVTIGGTRATPAQLATIRHQLGLNRPLPAQYLSWIRGVLHGEFGHSQLNGTSVGAELGRKLQVSIPLAAGAIAVAVLVAVPLGTWVAMRNGTAAASAVNALSQAGIAVPSLWLALLLVTVFAVEWKALPAQGFPVEGWASPGQAVRSLLLPWLALGLSEGAVLLRFVRSAVLGVLHAEFLRTARAKGLTRPQALLRHGFRNAALPVVSVLGLQLAALLVGTVVIETVFTLPGVGTMLVTDVGNRDLVKVQGEVLILVGAVLTIGFLIDVVHRILDPRLRETV